MSRLVSTYQRNESIKKIAVMAITALTSAVGLNFFLIPAKVFSAGMNGIAQIIATLLYTNLGIHINTGIFILFLNIPVFILGFVKLGKQSTILSFINVIGISVVTMFVPIVTVTTNPLMNAIMGGVLVGVGAGLSLKMGFNTGGMDIISLILSKTTGKTVGNFMWRRPSHSRNSPIKRRNAFFWYHNGNDDFYFCDCPINHIANRRCPFG